MMAVKDPAEKYNARFKDKDLEAHKLNQLFLAINLKKALDSKDVGEVEKFIKSGREFKY